MKKIVVLASVFALTACGLNGAEEETTETATVSDRSTDLGYEPFSSDNEADTMASNDDAQRNMAAIVSRPKTPPREANRPTVPRSVPPCSYRSCSIVRGLGPA